MKWLLSLVIIAFFAGCSQEEGDEPADQPSGRELTYTSTVTFVDSNGNDITSIAAAVADNDASRSEGLMDVRDLPEDRGMLFIFEDEQPRSFWMANTPLSLDIIYVNENFEIVRIHRDTPAYSNDNFESEAPAMFVVEVNAGFTLQHDITEQMRIRIE